MAVFMDTGGGDIYAAETKEECIAAMLNDSDDVELGDVFELPGTAKMHVENEDGTIGPLRTLNEEYTNLGHGYCIASSNV